MKELTKERMEEIRRLYEGMDRIYYQKEVNDLLEHINFLESIINDMGCDGITEAYRKGREKGTEEIIQLYTDYYSKMSVPDLNLYYGIKGDLLSLNEMMKMIKEGKIRRKL